jgi:hypothetical protein
MRVAFLCVALLGAVAFASASDDPTISLPGVLDLSKRRGRDSSHATLRTFPGRVCFVEVILRVCKYIWAGQIYCVSDVYLGLGLSWRAKILPVKLSRVFPFLAAPDTFDKFVNGAKHAIVEFYAVSEGFG